MIVYVLYLCYESSAISELGQNIAAFGTHVVMRDVLLDAFGAVYLRTVRAHFGFFEGVPA
jgi:hypothetical protein